MAQTIVIATKNKGKVVEIEKIMAGLGLSFITQDEAGVHEDIVEDGTTFEENSWKKASGVCKLCGLPCIADDSGLEVDALGGRPGIYSARYAGENATQWDLIHKLLSELYAVPKAERTARFVSVATLVLPDGTTTSCRGECEGTILTEPCGEGGFGYDPVFYVPAYSETFSSMPLALKNKISHRAIAFEKLKEKIKTLAIAEK